jgi:hypothetical protein
MAYGESMEDDVVTTVRYIEAYFTRRGASMELSPGRLMAHIQQYIRLRQKSSFFDISAPLNKPFKPVDWTAHDERVWCDWINYHCDLDSWTREVMQPMFGNGVCFWEARCEGWREEIHTCLPWWIRRSKDIVTRFDPTSEDPVEEPQPEIDPYLLEHGTSKQRRSQVSYI